MLTLYHFIIGGYFYILRFAALFNKDALRWVEGRKRWKQNLIEFNVQPEHQSKKRFWMHVSSLGEFEQGRELFELLKSNHPNWIYVLSFYSPSGYEKQKNYPYADYICYLPSDLSKEVNVFLDLLKPDLALFVKYDFWFNTLDALRLRNIPFFYISVYLRPDHFLLKPFFNAFLRIVMSAKCVFVQDKNTMNSLGSKNFSNVYLAGDTRLDRVQRIADNSEILENIHHFCKDSRVLILGSLWDIEFEMFKSTLSELIHKNWKIIIAPHKPEKQFLQKMETHFGNKVIRYSNLSHFINEKVVLIDSIGLLSSLYGYSHFAYIGGGFGNGIHNILEPAAHRIPLCFGPRYDKFPEAQQFLELGIAQCIRNKNELKQVLFSFKNDQEALKAKIDGYFAQNLGASQKIYSIIKHHFDD